jgi:DNA primase
LMIPILDLRGRVIGFGGRTLSDEQPKYLNSPETELFDKGNTLYGLDRAKDSISKTDRAVVVEGYFDVIALHAVGVTSAVAALGTALSSAQVKQLVKFTESKQIILNFEILPPNERLVKLLNLLIRDNYSYVFSICLQVKMLMNF